MPASVRTHTDLWTHSYIRPNRNFSGREHQVWDSLALSLATFLLGVKSPIKNEKRLSTWSLWQSKLSSSPPSHLPLLSIRSFFFLSSRPVTCRIMSIHFVFLTCVIPLFHIPGVPKGRYYTLPETMTSLGQRTSRIYSVRQLFSLSTVIASTYFVH